MPWKKGGNYCVVSMPRVLSNKPPFCLFVCLGHGLSRRGSKNRCWPLLVLNVKTGSHFLSLSSSSSKAEAGLKTLLWGQMWWLSSYFCNSSALLYHNFRGQYLIPRLNNFRKLFKNVLILGEFYVMYLIVFTPNSFPPYPCIFFLSNFIFWKHSLTLINVSIFLDVTHPLECGGCSKSHALKETLTLLPPAAVTCP